jgi:hypothetical protein
VKQTRGQKHTSCKNIKQAQDFGIVKLLDKQRKDRQEGHHKNDGQVDALSIEEEKARKKKKKNIKRKEWERK